MEDRNRRCKNMSPDGFRCGLPLGHDGEHSALMETSAPWFGNPDYQEPDSPNRYIVEVPVRGVQTYLVTARTAKEAKEKVNSLSIEGVDPVDCTITWHGMVKRVTLDDPGVGQESV